MTFWSSIKILNNTQIFKSLTVISKAVRVRWSYILIIKENELLDVRFGNYCRLLIYQK